MTALVPMMRIKRGHRLISPIQITGKIIAVGLSSGKVCLYHYRDGSLVRKIEAASTATTRFGQTGEVHIPPATMGPIGFLRWEPLFLGEPTERVFPQEVKTYLSSQEWRARSCAHLETLCAHLVDIAKVDTSETTTAGTHTALYHRAKTCSGYCIFSSKSRQRRRLRRGGCRTRGGGSRWTG